MLSNQLVVDRAELDRPMERSGRDPGELGNVMLTMGHA
jgi:hypothetical protein